MITALSVQQQIAEAFAAACPELATKGVSILCEDALDIATTAANALAKVGVVGIVSTPQFAPAGESADTFDCTPALEFYETAANRQKSGAVTALTCALYAARHRPTDYGMTNLSQDSPAEGYLRARLDLALTVRIEPETTPTTTNTQTTTEET
jgi:hypothetical protein